MRHRSTFTKPPPMKQEEPKEVPLTKEQLIEKSLHSSAFSIPQQQNLSLKNIFGKILKPYTISNIPIATNQIKTPSSLLQCNENLVAFPSVGQTGCVTVLSTDWLWNNGYRFGKEEQDAKCSSVVQHKHVVTDFTCSNNLLATSSMDETIRVCSFETDTQTRTIQCSNQVEFSTTEWSTPFRVWFHPIAKHLLLSSHKDSSLRFLDLQSQKQLFSFGSGDEKLFPKPIFSLAWNYQANVAAVSCQDSSVRFVDPRSKLLIHELELPHCSGAKPSQLLWCGNTPYVTHVGFSKQGERILSLVDSRKTDQTLSFTIVDRGSFPLQPFYDPSLHYLMLCGAGDSQIKFYEPLFSTGSFQSLNQFTTDTPTKALALLPKTMVNVKEVEVNRVLRMTQDSIEPLGLFIPRKQAQYFQDDLYSNIIDNAATELTVQDWMQSKSVEYKLVNLKPEGMQSISEVTPVKQQHQEEEEEEEEEEEKRDNEEVEEGQKEATDVIPTTTVVRKRRTSTMVRNDLKNIVKTTATSKPQVSENDISSTSQEDQSSITKQEEAPKQQEMILEGYLDKKNPNFLGWKKRWFRVTLSDEICYYESHQTVDTLLGCIAWNDILTIHPTTNKWKDFTFVIKTQTRDYHLSAASMQDREIWIHHIRSVHSQFLANKQQQLLKDQQPIEGFLMKKNPNSSTWKPRYFVYDTEEHVLRYSQKKSMPILGSIKMNQVLHVNDSLEVVNSFQLVTWNRVYHLQASSSSEKIAWLNLLLQAWKQIHQQEIDTESKEESLMEENEAEEEDSKVEAEEKKEELRKEEESSNHLQGYLLRLNQQSNFSRNATIDKFFAVLDMETTHSLLFFSEESQCESYLHSKESELIVDKISLNSIESVNGMEMNQGKLLHLSQDEFRLYFCILTNDGSCIYLGAPSLPMQQIWIDSLQLVIDYYSNDNLIVETKVEETKVEETSSKSQAVEPKKKKNLIEELQIDDKSPSDLSKLKEWIEFSLLKNGQQKILYQVIGNKQALRVMPVAIHMSSLNSNHVYVFDCGTNIYQWNGMQSNRMERAKALEVSSTLKFKERAGNAKTFIIEEGNEEPENQKLLGVFYRLFSEGKVTSEALPREQVMQELDNSVVMYRISKNKVSQVSLTKNQLPSHTILNTNYVYILLSNSELLIWNGKQSTLPQRKLAQQLACKLLQDKQVICIMKMAQGGEALLWKERFCDYPGMLPISVSNNQQSTGQKEKQIKTIDVESMIKSSYYSTLYKRREEEVFVADYKTVELQIWRIENFVKKELDKEWYGQFFSAESYIILHSFVKAKSETVNHVIYFWQGRECRNREKGASTLLTMELDDTLERKNTCQIRVEEHREPLAFLKLFENYVVYRGYMNDYLEWPTKTRFYQLFNNDKNDVAMTFEISCHASQLNSNSIYILNSPETQFVWIGNHSNAVERQQGKQISQLLAHERSVIVMNEWEETEEFWKRLGGKCTYSQFHDAQLPVKNHTHSIRVFKCFWMDSLEVDELIDPCQDDFYEAGNCFIIDAHWHLFVYVSHTVSDQLKKHSLQLAKEYLTKKTFAQGGWVVEQGKETISFTGNIRGWNGSNTTQSALTNRSRRTSTHTRMQQAQQQPPLQSIDEVLSKYQTERYTYQELLQDPLPMGVDKQHLEKYLNDQEFEKVFQMKRDEFEQLVQWKQQKYKQKVYLF